MADSPARRCSIVIVTHNGRDLLDDCLGSVLAQLSPPHEVILVDNASSDGSAEHVRRRFPSVRIVRAERNLGFAGGNNEGVRHAQGEFVVLLNNDTRVPPDWLEHLAGAMDDATVGIACSNIRTEGIPERFFERNGSINLLGHNIMRKFADPANIFFAGGASLIYRRQQLGLPFDDEYFLYGEDVYLSLRVRFLGLRVVHVPGSLVEHKGSQTVRRQAAPFITMYQERNRLLNLLIFFGVATHIRILPLVLGGAAGKLILGATGRRYSPAGLLRAYAWLLTHGGVIAEKRRAIRNTSRAAEADVLSWMTADLTNGESTPGRILNHVSRLYHRAVGIRTLESLPEGSR